MSSRKIFAKPRQARRVLVMLVSTAALAAAGLTLGTSVEVRQLTHAAQSALRSEGGDRESTRLNSSH